MRLTWSYGVTTVPGRFEEYLPRTLGSLALAGFDRPRLFVDGAFEHQVPERYAKLEVTCRTPKIRAAGNWTLALLELYVRQPLADRYAIFQDDLVAVRNLREYLEQQEYPRNSYQNLYTTPANQSLAPLAMPGRARGVFYPSNQNGKGALALVFDRTACLALLGSPHWLERPQDAKRGWRSIDGGVVTSLAKAGIREFVHDPSLVQHIGIQSTMNKSLTSLPDAPPHVWSPNHLAESFPGETYDALDLLRPV